MPTFVLDPALSELVWWGTRTLRLRAHAARGCMCCPTRVVPYGPADPAARQLHLRCRDDGCLGIVHTIYATTIERLRGHDEPTERDAWRRYARTVVSSQVAEMERKARVSRGMPARPTRGDGPAGRVNDALSESLTDPTEIEWTVQLFRMMRGYACRDQRTRPGWPLDAWAAEKSRVDGRIRALGTRSVAQEISQDIAHILEVADQVAGVGWVDDNIRRPLAVLVPVPYDEPDALSAGVDDPVDAVLLSDFVRRYARWRVRGVPPEPAFHRATHQVFGCAPHGDLSEAIADLEGRGLLA